MLLPSVSEIKRLIADCIDGTEQDFYVVLLVNVVRLSDLFRHEVHHLALNTLRRQSGKLVQKRSQVLQSRPFSISVVEVEEEELSRGSQFLPDI